MALRSTPSSLLDRLLHPDNRVAWDEFVGSLTPLIRKWARQSGLQNADAADVVQDVFVTVVEMVRTSKYDRTKSAKAWLYAITWNKCRDRRKAKAPVLDPDAMAEALIEDPLEGKIQAAYDPEMVREALAAIHVDFQEATWKACWMSVVEGRPGAQIAAELGITVHAVYDAPRRVLRRLRQELTGFAD